MDDTAATTRNLPVTVPVLANDTNPDNLALTVAIGTAPAHGTAVANPDGTVSYTPAAGFVGADTFTYTAMDPFGRTGTATVTVTVARGNAARRVGRAACADLVPLRPVWLWRLLLLGFAIVYLLSSGLQAWVPPLLPFLAAAAVELQFFVAGRGGWQRFELGDEIQDMPRAFADVVGNVLI